MAKKKASNKEWVIPFRELGYYLSRPGHYEGGFPCSHLTSGGKTYELNRSDLGWDAPSPLLTDLLTDKAMEFIAYAVDCSAVDEWEGEDYDDDVDNAGETIWSVEEEETHAIVPYVEDLDTARFRVGDIVFDIDTRVYGTVKEVLKSRKDGKTLRILVDKDEKLVDPHFCVRETDEVFK